MVHGFIMVTYDVCFMNEECGDAQFDNGSFMVASVIGPRQCVRCDAQFDNACALTLHMSMMKKAFNNLQVV
jgi:hypothetical protein